MPILDFTEIPPANAGSQRDSFELFAREVLALCGFQIQEGPDRGADGGRDLIVLERRTGLVGESVIRWLVSCKHFAHRGAAVGVSDEQNVRDRMAAHNCQGFLGFYSTLPSSGLTNLLRPSIPELTFWDRESIEERILRTPDGLTLARRWFPRSMAEWERTNVQPAHLYSGSGGLSCQYCGTNLLEPPSGIIVFLNSDGPNGQLDYPYVVQDVYWCCKGECNRTIASVRRRPGLVDGWKDIPDVVNPLGFIQTTMATMNRLRGGEQHSDKAWTSYREFLLEVFRYVARHPTDSERQRSRDLAMLPSVLGGSVVD